MRSISDVPSTLTLAERAQELRDLGVPDWEAANRLGITLGALQKAMSGEKS